MQTLEQKIEAYDNRLLDAHLAGEDEWWAYVTWAEGEDLDPELDDTREEWNRYCEQMAEDAAVERYESRMLDDYYDREYP